MKKTLLIVGGSLIALGILVGIWSYVYVPSFHNAVNGLFAAAPAPKKDAPVVSAQATEAPTQAVADASKNDAKAETVDFAPPANALALKSEDVIVGYFYVLNKEGATEIVYPKQATLLITAGNANVTKGDVVVKMATDKKGTVGNVFSDVCESDSCKVTVDGFKAGNVGVTIVFGGNEDPKDSLTDATNGMFKAPNCGGSGCKTVNVYNGKGKSWSFKSAIKADDVAKVLTAPAEPFVKINIKFADVPADAKTLLDGNDNVVGHEYYLTDKKAFVSIPEGGITVFVCGTDTTIDGTLYKAGSAVVFNGTASDGSTPKDLNFTLSVESSDPTMVRVYMFYGGKPSDELAALKAQYPDKTWVTK